MQEDILAAFIEFHSLELNWHVKCTRRVCVQLWPILVRRFVYFFWCGSKIRMAWMGRRCPAELRTSASQWTGQCWTARRHSHSTVEWESIVLWEANTHSALVAPADNAAFLCTCATNAPLVHWSEIRCQLYVHLLSTYSNILCTFLDPRGPWIWPTCTEHVPACCWP